jgi:hypothetical protein
MQRISIEACIEWFTSTTEVPEPRRRVLLHVPVHVSIPTQYDCDALMEAVKWRE